MPGSVTSEVYLCMPVTSSRPFTLGNEVPAIFQSLAGVTGEEVLTDFSSFWPLVSSP